MILSTAASQALGTALADALGEPHGVVAYEQFPDGERFVQIEDDIAGERAVIVGGTPACEDHIDLLLLQDAAREAGASSVVTIIPYMGYARQDKQFSAGEPVSARAMAKAISTGTDRVLVVNPHEQSVCDFFSVPATAVDAAGRLAVPLPDGLESPLFLAPDAGATELAETVRDAYGTGTVDHFEKVRHAGDDVEITPGETDVSGRDVVVVDDIIATGSTMSQAIGALDDRGVGRVFVTCVHPLFARNARSKLAAAGVDAIYATDTIERSVTTVSAAPAVADTLDQ